jgi:hypothetical protein
MSQEQFAQHGRSYKALERKSDTIFWISLGVGFALVGALAFAHWSSSTSASNATARSTLSVQAKTSHTDPVYQCDGHVSFKP